MISRFKVVSVLLGLAAASAHAQAPYQPQPASPPKDAGYLLADGTVQIVGWDDLSGIFERLDALYGKTHPGTKFKYVPGNLMSPQHSLIFGETVVFLRGGGALLLPLALSGTCAYAADYDLASLPPYKWEPGPEYERGKHCHGTVCDGEWGVIRIHGTELTQHLVHLWEDDFLKLHPNIRFSDYFVPSGFSGLTAGTADLNVMGHSAWRSDLKAFEEVHGYLPLEIMFATGGFNLGKGNTPGVIFFVNKDNPISGLTLKQLDGIFGAERNGGWKGSTWSTEARRGAAENIRSWGQLGLSGEWANQPIRLYGFDATLSNWSDLIQRVVFKGGDKWNPALQEMVRGGNKGPSDLQIVKAVANDKYAIGFNLMRVVETEPGVKVLAIAASENGPFVQPTRDTMYRRTYPLSNAVYIYIDRPPGKPISARVKEFLAYVLSREGQQSVVEDGMYLPLNPEAAREQREKLR
jgi:phosphate transport system substrate-binding protein